MRMKRGTQFTERTIEGTGARRTAAPGRSFNDFDDDISLGCCGIEDDVIWRSLGRRIKRAKKEEPN